MNLRELFKNGSGDSLPKPTATQRKSGDDGPWPPEHIRGIRSNPCYAGLGIYTALVPEVDWVHSAVKLIEQEGAEQFLVNMLHMLRESFPSNGPANKVISLTNSEGETIEVKRGDNGVILVRHSEKDADRFGEFNTVDMLTKDPTAWESLAKQGIYINSETGKDAISQIGNIGFLRIDDEQILVGAEDGKLICEAIKQLD